MRSESKTFHSWRWQVDVIHEHILTLYQSPYRIYVGALPRRCAGNPVCAGGAGAQAMAVSVLNGFLCKYTDSGAGSAEDKMG